MFRVHDPRIGRFLSVDPLAPSYPWYTPYQFAGNTPIWAVDLEGAEPKTTNEEPATISDGNAIAHSGSTEVVVTAKHTDANAMARDMSADGQSIRRIASFQNNSTILNEYSRLRAAGQDASHLWVNEPYEFSSGLQTETGQAWEKIATAGIGAPLIAGPGLEVAFSMLGANMARELFDFGVDLAWETATGTPSPIILGLSDIAELGGRRALKEIIPSLCFIRGTRVLTIDSLQSIENLELGQLVVVSLEHAQTPSKYELSANKDVTLAIYETELEAEQWQALELYLSRGLGDTTFIELLRPTWWVEENINQIGTEVYLSLPEMQVNGYARVTSIKPVPLSVSSNNLPQRAVIGKFINKSDDYYKLYFKGLVEPLGVTGGHPIWSSTRSRWVDAGNLEIGEWVTTHQGILQVIDKEYIGEPIITYNIEVHDAHNYYVSDSCILVHNTGAGNPCGNAKRAIQQLKSGTDVYVKNIQDARKLLSYMPELRPHVSNWPSESGKLFKGSIFGDIWKQPGNTFRGDLINPLKDGFLKNVHPPSAVTKNKNHRIYPHYNIRFSDGTKSAILIITD